MLVLKVFQLLMSVVLPDPVRALRHVDVIQPVSTESGLWLDSSGKAEPWSAWPINFWSLSKSVPFSGQTGCPYQLSSFPGQPSPVFLGAFFPSDTVYWGFFFFFLFFSFLHRMRTWRKNFRICFLKKISRCLYPKPQPRYFQMMVVKCRLSFKERAHEQDWWAQKVSLVAVA